MKKIENTKAGDIAREIRQKLIAEKLSVADRATIIANLVVYQLADQANDEHREIWGVAEQYAKYVSDQLEQALEAQAWSRV